MKGTNNGLEEEDPWAPVPKPKVESREDAWGNNNQPSSSNVEGDWNLVEEKKRREPRSQLGFQDQKERGYGNGKPRNDYD